MLFSVLLISLLLGTQLSTVISFFWSKEQKQQEHAQELFSSSLDSDYSLLIYPSGEHENGVLTTLSREDCVKPLEKTLCHAFIAAKNNLSMREGISKEERIEKEEEEDVVSQRREEEEQIAQICEGCSLFNEFGVQMKSCSDLMLSPSLPSQQSQRVFLVQRNRLFVFPTIDIGHRVTLSHVKTAGTGEEAKAVELVTLSHSPRVFQLHNFFTHAEADALILSALTISEEAYRLKRSTTGNGESIRVDPSRTSDTCFDPFSETAMTLKQRSFELLGIRPFHNDWADGLQLLRYNVSGGYNSHMDYIEPAQGTNGHDYNSAGNGTNRFATVFLYLSDVEEGGETVFTQSEVLAQDFDVNELLASKNLTHVFEHLAWEKLLLRQCRTRLAVRPKKLNAILFYSQHPDGRADYDSQHGACPVLAGQKWAANLWVWNGPRATNPAVSSSTDGGGEQPLTATFESFDVPDVELFWTDVSWGVLPMSDGPIPPIASNTYAGHVWTLRSVETGEVLLTWRIESGVPNQRFVLRASDIKPAGITTTAEATETSPEEVQPVDSDEL